MRSTAERLEFAPPRDQASPRAFVLALLVHILLIAALTWGVNWKRTDDAASFEAELWSGAPQQTAPKELVAPPPPPAPTPPPAPPVQVPAPPPPAVVKAPEVKVTPPLPDVDIALEKEKKRKLQQQQNEAQAQKAEKLQDKRDAELQQAKKEKELKAKEDLADRKAEELAQKAEAKKQAAREQAKEKEQEKEKEKRIAAASAAAAAEKQKKAAAVSATVEKQKQAVAEKQKIAAAAAAASAAKQKQVAAAASDKQHQETVKRIMGMAGADSSGAAGSRPGSGSAKAEGPPSAGYAGKVRAKVLPNVMFADEISGNPKAEVEVSTTSDGTIMSQRLVKSSGNKAWDEAAVKAIVRTGSLPRDIDGRIPTPMIIELRPN